MIEPIKQEKPEQPKEEIIVKFCLQPDGSISMGVGERANVQLMCFVHRLLGIEIDKKIIDAKINAVSSGSRIITPPKRGGIINFMRGKNAG